MRSKTPTLSVLIAALGLVLLLVWLARRSSERDLQEPPVAVAELSSPADEAASSAAPETADPEPRPQPRAAAPPPAADLVKATERGLIETVKEWVAAWSERRVDDYLACYSRTFVPEGGVSRRSWEAQRRDRISAPLFVRVAITALETEILEPGIGRATFLQYYRSDGYSDTVRKTLDLVWEDGRWRIQRERSADSR